MVTAGRSVPETTFINTARLKREQAENFGSVKQTEFDVESLDLELVTARPNQEGNSEVLSKEMLQDLAYHAARLHQVILGNPVGMATPSFSTDADRNDPGRALDIEFMFTARNDKEKPFHLTILQARPFTIRSKFYSPATTT